MWFDSLNREGGFAYHRHMETADPRPTLDSRFVDEALKALDQAIAEFGCQAGTVHLLADGVLVLAASRNIPEFVVGLVSVVPVGKGIAGLAAERREPVSLCNLQTDTSGQARPNAKATGMEGSVAVPAIDEGGVLRGVLGIAKAEAYDWSDAEKKRLAELAAGLANHVGKQ
jgi:signal transduction protein with GAF and PtsI domain